MASTAPLLEGLRAADPALPAALSEFDRIAGAASPAPDFVEWSAHFGVGACDAARLTYYFDAGAHGDAGLRAAGERFVALSRALSVELPRAVLDAYAALVPAAEEVLQVVLGIDERAEGRRLKLYVVLRDAAPALVDGLLDAVAAGRGAELDPSKVYILGLDFCGAGLADAKLYFRLDRARLRRSVANLRDVAELFSATREVVLQRCLLRDRSQLYLHADNPAAIGRYLLRRGDAPAAELVRRHDQVARALPRGRLEPWIVSFGYRDHRLLLDEGNVYFHLHGADERTPSDGAAGETGGGHPRPRPLS